MPQPNLTGDVEDNRNDLVPDDVATSDEPKNLDSSDDVEVISFSETESEQSIDGSEVSEASEEVTESSETDVQDDPQPTNAAVAQAVAELGDFTGEPQEISTETKVETVTESTQPAEPIKSDSATEATAQPSAPSKKGKGWLIGIIIAAILFLSICGAAIWYFVFYNNPDKVAYDAINNLITANNVMIDGGIGVISEDMQILIDIDSTSSKLPNSSTVKALLTTTAGGDEESFSINLDIGSIQMKDGDIYLQVSGILDSLKKAGIDEDDEDYALMLDYLEEFEGEWWKISIPEIVDEFELGEFGEGIKEAYTCVVKAANADNSAALAKLYDQNRFIKVDPIKEIRKDNASSLPERGYKYYEVSFDKDKLANYVNSIPDLDHVKEVSNCLNDVFSEYYDGSFEITSENISASDIDIPEDLKVYLEISQFGHELRSIQGSYDDTENGEDNEFSFGIVFKYDAAPSVSAPSKYRPITELIEEIMMDLYDGSIDIDVDDYYPAGLDPEFNLDDLTMEV